MLTAAGLAAGQEPEKSGSRTFARNNLWKSRPQLHRIFCFSPEGGNLLSEPRTMMKIFQRTLFVLIPMLWCICAAPAFGDGPMPVAVSILPQKYFVEKTRLT
jgi:hypothetical protein